MKIDGFLKSDRIVRLPIRKPLLVSKRMPIEKLPAKMREMKVGCALVWEKGKLLGIITERDILRKLVAPQLDTKTPVEKLMTPNPKVVRSDQTVGEALKIMSEGRYRNLPVMDEQGAILGYLSVKDIIRYLANFFPFEVYNLPPEPGQVPQTPEGA